MKRGLRISLLVTPVVLSSLLIGAHFLRHAQFFLMGAGLTPLIVLFVRRPLSVRYMQGILFLAGVSWIRTTYHLTAVRATMGMPYGKILLILCPVAGFTFASIFVFRSRTLREFYKL